MVRRRWQVSTGPVTAREAQRTRVDLGLNPLEENVALELASLTLMPIVNGGTGASTASGARAGLGLGSIATQDANAVAITGGTITGITDLALTAKASDPADPADGTAVMWLSDGTGSGDAGDLMVKITVGATTKTITLIDWSTF